MRHYYIIIVVIVVIIGAIAAGWISESRSKLATTRPELEIPTHIDYFLAEVKYKIFDNAGTLDYQVYSPYMEHFPLNDISRIKFPIINVYRENGDWNVKARNGELMHQQNILQLSDKVVVKRLGANAMRISSESMLFEPSRDLITSETNVVIESDNSRITGDMAVFDLHNQVYSMKNIKAIYNHES
jgi:LPS export ABC transporter protein LptC